MTLYATKGPSPWLWKLPSGEAVVGEETGLPLPSLEALVSCSFSSVRLLSCSRLPLTWVGCVCDLETSDFIRKSL